MGIAAITAFGLFLSHHYLGLGMGGMERVAAFPLLLWAMAVGVLGLIRQTPMPDAMVAGKLTQPAHRS